MDGHGQRTRTAGKQKIAEKAKEHQGERTDICQKSDRSSIDTKTNWTKCPNRLGHAIAMPQIQNGTGGYNDMRYKLTAAEQETTFVHCRSDVEAVVFTSDRLRMMKLDEMCEQFPDVYRCVWVDSQIMGDGLPAGKRYSIPARYVRFAKPASAAQLAAARASVSKINSTREN